jgi:hypothetical protein
MASLLQESINVAAKDWGLQCLRYEISKSLLAFVFVSEFFLQCSHGVLQTLPLSSFFRGHISSPWSEGSYGDASRSRTQKESSSS